MQKGLSITLIGLYLKLILYKFGFPDLFVENIMALYTNPPARIKVNGGRCHLSLRLEMA